jgi:hypothetical protein
MNRCEEVEELALERGVAIRFGSESNVASRYRHGKRAVTASGFETVRRSNHISQIQRSVN